MSINFRSSFLLLLNILCGVYCSDQGWPYYKPRQHKDQHSHNVGMIKAEGENIQFFLRKAEDVEKPYIPYALRSDTIPRHTDDIKRSSTCKETHPEPEIQPNTEQRCGSEQCGNTKTNKITPRSFYLNAPVLWRAGGEFENNYELSKLLPNKPPTQPYLSDDSKCGDEGCVDERYVIPTVYNGERVGVPLVILKNDTKPTKDVETSTHAVKVLSKTVNIEKKCGVGGCYGKNYGHTTAKAFKLGGLRFNIPHYRWRKFNKASHKPIAKSSAKYVPSKESGIYLDIEPEAHGDKPGDGSHYRSALFKSDPDKKIHLKETHNHLAIEPENSKKDGHKCDDEECRRENTRNLRSVSMKSGARSGLSINDTEEISEGISESHVETTSAYGDTSNSDEVAESQEKKENSDSNENDYSLGSTSVENIKVK